MSQYVLSLSYGKDSLACLGAIEKLGLPLDRIVHAEVWATETISADLPPMVEFKAKADRIIKERWGIEVEHYSSNFTYDSYFHAPYTHKSELRDLSKNGIYGFPYRMGNWCNSRLKVSVLSKIKNQTKGAVQYIGIAADEPNRFHNLDGITKISPLVEIGWTEADAMKWCIENDLRSPTYDMSTRGGAGSAIISEPAH